MNQEVKAEWTKALRSGDYSQTTGRLRRATGDGKGGFCCLGVLCDLAVKAGVTTLREVVPFEDDDDLVFYHYGSNEETAVLPPEVRDWAGLSGENPYLDGGPQPDEDEYVRHDTLASTNDGGATFSEIADIIDQKF